MSERSYHVLFNDTLNTFYLRLYGVRHMVKDHSVSEKGRKEGNVLFNDTLNTLYLWLYGVRHMVKDHSDSEKGNCCCHIGYSFRLTARVLLYMHHPTDKIAQDYTCRGALAGTRNSSMGSSHEGSIRRPHYEQVKCPIILNCYNIDFNPAIEGTLVQKGL